MAYSNSTPPSLIGAGIGGPGKIWKYESTDTATDVDADGYITNAKSLGMTAGDLVFVRDTNSTPTITTMHTVAAINANGSANLSNSDGTNSD